jgi:hypothetical protein
MIQSSRDDRAVSQGTPKLDRDSQATFFIERMSIFTDEHRSESEIG